MFPLERLIFWWGSDSVGKRHSRPSATEAAEVALLLVLLYTKKQILIREKHEQGLVGPPVKRLP